VPFHQRNLPHSYPPGATLSLTWRLYGSYQKPGARWLQDPRIARIVADALNQGEVDYHLYESFAWVIMPNHVHAIMRPENPLPKIMRWLKGSTAREANIILNRTGQPFWQYETYDHYIRTTEELNQTIRYVEQNPVRAGLAESIEQWPWSSAARDHAVP
jgi:REP element-mobilizing transposase RayT